MFFAHYRGLRYKVLGSRFRVFFNLGGEIFFGGGDS